MVPITPILTPAANSAIERSVKIADDRGDRQVDTHHLLLGLLEGKQGAVFTVLANLGIEPDCLRQTVLSITRDKPI
jgi:ATP-dependent Clp protease ATP-binding subunit ClpA